MYGKTRSTSCGKGVLITLFISVLFVWGTGMVSGGDGPGDKEEIVSVVNRFLAVLGSRDIEEAKKILMPDGVSFSVREKDESGKSRVRVLNFQDLIKSLSEGDVKYKEAIAGPKILLHEEIAVLWAPYEFYRDGKFSHCGVDAFTLVRTEAGWKIAGIVYTVEKTGCPGH